MMKRVWLVLAIAGLVLAFACEKNDDVTNPDDTEDGGGIAPDEIDFARTFPPLLANGADAVQVVATVVDSRGRGLSGVKVNFSTTEGTIDGFALSGDRGKAIATLTSEASAVDLVATVTAEASTSPVGQVQAERVDGAAEGAGES
ncbi:MAG: Ig-like domain-containing protein, partial [Candidatus Eisenbacteria bacterium]|nr:Ig-like domain-containing protein [Candidatus Eisenbacteria bacterium]